MNTNCQTFHFVAGNRISHFCCWLKRSLRPRANSGEDIYVPVHVHATMFIFLASFRFTEFRFTELSSSLSAIDFTDSINRCRPPWLSVLAHSERKQEQKLSTNFIRSKSILVITSFPTQLPFQMSDKRKKWRDFVKTMVHEIVRHPQTDFALSLAFELGPWVGDLFEEYLVEQGSDYKTGKEKVHFNLIL